MTEMNFCVLLSYTKRKNGEGGGGNTTKNRIIDFKEKKLKRRKDLENS